MAELSNIHYLPGCKPPAPGEPPEKVVRLCKALLARAERGEIAAFAYAAVAPNACVRTGWRFGRGRDSDLNMAVQSLAQRMLATWAEE